MPITKSAKKALRQNVRRRARNLKQKETYKTATKRIRKLVAAGSIPEAEKLIPLAYKALDKAAKTGVLKKNAAARRKSQLIHWLRKSKHPA